MCYCGHSPFVVLRATNTLQNKDDFKNIHWEVIDPSFCGFMSNAFGFQDLFFSQFRKTQNNVLHSYFNGGNEITKTQKKQKDITWQRKVQKKYLRNKRKGAS